MSGTTQQNAALTAEQIKELHAQLDTARKTIRQFEEERASEQPLGRAFDDVLAERRRQINELGYTPDHDDDHVCGEISAYAAVYAMPPAARDWDASNTGYGSTFREALTPINWKVPEDKDRREELVNATAMLIAEIERIDRAAQKAQREVPREEV